MRRISWSITGGAILANAACLGANGFPEWYIRAFRVDSIGGNARASRFHVWRMDWDMDHVSIFLDNQLLNRVEVSKLVNKDGTGFNPFQQPHYMLLSLAVGGINGGDPCSTTFPRRIEVDYIRVYQTN